ncbi:MAG: hypothetical protein P9X24_14640 [Candidatus Hatepunaea meridiana]|nr:hypothetical protein [Candidatus Hatepunaea meridiana]
MFRKNLPSLRRSRPEQATELNLTPIMNLMVVLIPLLLSVAEFTKLALLEYLPPLEPAEDAGGGKGDDEKPPDEEKKIRLNLIVNLSDEGITQISMYGKMKLGEHFYEIPANENGGYNFEVLNDSLYAIKAREVGDPIGQDSVQNELTGEWTIRNLYKAEDGDQVTITAIGKTTFQNIINVMDIVRFKEIGLKKHELFPNSMLKQWQ